MRNPTDSTTTTELEQALATGHGPVVVTGARTSAVVAAVGDVLPRVLDGHAVLVVDPEEHDLADVLATATAPVVVLVTDARPDVLDRLPELGERLDADRRLVLTTRPGFLGAALAPVDAVVVPGGPLDGVAPAGLSGPARAVVDAVVDRDRLGVAGALDEGELAALVGTTGPLTDAVDEAVLAGLVRLATRGGAPHLAPDPSAVDQADGPAGRPVTAEFGRRLRDAGDPARLVVPGRVAVARGDAGLAPVLLGHLDPDEVPVDVAWAVAVAAEEHGLDHAAERWHLSVAVRDTDDAPGSRRAAVVAEPRLGHPEAARDLPAGTPDGDRPAQHALARLALVPDGEGRDDARRRFALAAAADADLAAGAAAALAHLHLADGDDEAALTRLRQAAGSSVRRLAVSARTTTIPVLARLGRLTEAQDATDDLAAFLTTADPASAHEALVLARAAIHRRRGDLDAAAEVLRAAGGGVQVAAATAELDLQGDRWEGLLDDDRLEWRHLHRPRRDRPELSRRGHGPTDPVRRLWAARGEAAFRGRRYELAAECFGEVATVRDRVGDGAAARLGVIALREGDAESAPGHLEVGAASAD
ncbi:hypothetical protein, partial [Actinomycetospora atypica]